MLSSHLHGREDLSQENLFPISIFPNLTYYSICIAFTGNGFPVSYILLLDLLFFLPLFSPRHCIITIASLSLHSFQALYVRHLVHKYYRPFWCLNEMFWYSLRGLNYSFCWKSIVLKSTPVSAFPEDMVSSSWEKRKTSWTWRPIESILQLDTPELLKPW